ncbi:DUF680 domain-containing protein [Mesorhizobium sp. 131-2-1]|uniref:DUF680 domain-containing protein n=1 Tax=Mesorhizobium sp. 131-2-1 TaxID=2744518 RepID=UPI0019266CAF|nr:DUF680 domain-containing protein [Mesorhizobium sp. 131-2-1]BCG94140.1 hypothetical protein MesoLj131a_30040 [Mesorhizobium sp. 131-2-1]
MIKIALAAAAVLAMSGIALAGSAHYGTINSNHSGFVDQTFTASIRKPAMGKHSIVDPRTTTVAPTGETWPEFNRGIWGN